MVYKILIVLLLGFKNKAGSFQDLVCSQTSGFVERVLDPGVTPLLVIHNATRHIHLVWLLEVDTLDMSTAIWLDLENHDTSHHISGGGGSLHGSFCALTKLENFSIPIITWLIAYGYALYILIMTIQTM